MANGGGDSYKVLTSGNTWKDPNAYYVGDPPPDNQLIPGHGHVYPAFPAAGTAKPFDANDFSFLNELAKTEAVRIEDETMGYLIQMLELEPSETPSGVVIEWEGARYSLHDILHAQMKFMFRMNILLIHRQLGRTHED